MIHKGLFSKEYYELLLVASTIDGLLDKMKKYVPPKKPEWLKINRV